MAKIQCKMCGGMLELPESVFSGKCPYCETISTFPKLPNDQLEQLYNRAEHFRRINDYDKAVETYEKLIDAVPDDPEAYWGLVLSRFGIEYVEDPLSHERIPTCHRVQIDSILADADYLAALERAGANEKAIYEAEARRIADIQKDILAISNQEEPFDIFICYKESDENGERTKDSVIAQDIYYALTNEGMKVFFARITLEGKLGQQYEPYIFAALNSAKAMLVIGSSKEYFNAPWVRNEWSRFLAIMKKDRSKLLIPCYKDMDAYDIPEELSMFQAQNMSKIGFIQDILHGLKKVAAKEAPAVAQMAIPVAADQASGKNDPLLRRAQLFLEVGDFDSAYQYCERMLDKEPENGWAYYYRLKSEMRSLDNSGLVKVNLFQHSTFQLIQRFADEELQEIIGELLQEKAAYDQAKQIDTKIRQESQSRCMQINKLAQRIKLNDSLIIAIQRASFIEDQLQKQNCLLTYADAQSAANTSGNTIKSLLEREKFLKIMALIKALIIAALAIGVFIAVLINVNS